MVPFRSCKTCFAATQWVLLGLLENLAKVATAYVIAGLIHVGKYPRTRVAGPMTPLPQLLLQGGCLDPYTEKLLTKLKMNDCNSAKIPVLPQVLDIKL